NRKRKRLSFDEAMFLRELEEGLEHLGMTGHLLADLRESVVPVHERKGRQKSLIIRTFDAKIHDLAVRKKQNAPIALGPILRADPLPGRFRFQVPVLSVDLELEILVQLFD